LGQPRILLVNHGRAAEYKGGDGVQINETGKRLARRGYDVAQVQADRPDVSQFDLVHLFNARTVESLRQQLEACKAAGVPTVLSPIWVSIPRAIWGSRTTFRVLSNLQVSSESEVDSMLQRLRLRKLVLDDANTQVHPEGNHNGDPYRVKELATLIKRVDGLLPNSWLELQAVRNDLHWFGDQFEVAHYGVDPKIFLDADPTPFRSLSGIKGSFVLQAGRIEPAKNQAMLCWALRKTGIPIVLIGSTANWPGYAKLCRDIAGSQLTIIDHLEQPMLASAFAAANVHVLASWMETCGLVSLEAALAGTAIVGSTFGHELEYLKQDAWYGDPADPESLRIAVESALDAGRECKRTCNLRQRILEIFNWERTTTQTELLYRKVLERKRR
jgi:glycosyltransferase involved in cell wall biosynthesis